MNLILEHLSILGHKVKDRVTGMTGVATSVSFDLYGCVQVLIDPGLDKDGKSKERFFLDIKRLDKTSKQPVMALPNYISGAQAEGRQGAAEKPIPAR